MKIIIFLGIVALLAVSCHTDSKPADISQELKNAMSHYLYKNIQFDSSKVKYRINSVAYFEESTYYNCVFEVRMILPAKDTVGIMKATIAKKDFEQIKRLQ